MFFGRPSGPGRMILAIIGVGVLGLLSFVVFNLNTRLDNQQRANETTLQASHGIVEVNDHVTTRLNQLTALTSTAQKALDETRALSPLLHQLQEAVKPAAAMVAKGSEGGQISNAQLTNVQSVLNQIKGKVVPLVKSASTFGAQGKQLLVVINGLVDDVEGSVAAAKKINSHLPLPG